MRHPDDVVDLVNEKMAALAEQERFEEAGVHRDRLASFERAAARTQRLTSLTRCPEVVAVRREDRTTAQGHRPSGRSMWSGTGGWRRPARSRPAWTPATTSSSSAGPPRPSSPSVGPIPAATAEESERILHWLELPGIRLVDIDGEWTCPVRGAAQST